MNSIKIWKLNCGKIEGQDFLKSKLKAQGVT